MATFHHFGVPTSLDVEGAAYFEDLKVHGTNPDDHPYRVEFLKFEEGCPLHELIQTRPHAAFMVDNLDEAVAGKNVIAEPFQVTDTLRVAFIADGDAVLELMQTT